MKIKKDPYMTCLVCGSPYIEMHHVFYGTANRSVSDKYGYVVPLCNYHHTGADGVHGGNKSLDDYLKRMMQERFEQTYSRERFIEEFGKSYL